MSKVSGFVVCDEMSAALSKYAGGVFKNLTDSNNVVVPLLRVLKTEDMMKNNADPVAAHKERLSRRRTPRSAAPVVDFLLEAGRLIKYPDMPSRQKSLFANLGGYQTAYVKDGYKPFFVIPHESARISVSAIRDFFIPDQERICRFVKDQFDGIKCGRFDLSTITGYRKEFEACDYEQSHGLLEVLDLIKKWFDGEPGNFPELQFLLRFWRESFLVKDGLSPQNKIGSETVIEGPVYYIALTE